MHVVLFEEIGQVMVFFVGPDNGEVGTYDKILNARFGGLLNEPSEIGIHFWSAPGQIKGMCTGIANYLQTLLHGFAGHDLLSVGTSIHMAMLTYLVAHIAYIDL